MSETPEIVSVSEREIDQVAPLFDAYRCWYGAEPDLSAAKNFLIQRLRNNESSVFMARWNGTPVGFAQLYPVFSSVSLAAVWILNDLFVVPAARRQGIGTLLLETAAEFGREMGAIRLELQTGSGNLEAQAVYNSHGWTRDNEFFRFSLSLV